MICSECYGNKSEKIEYNLESWCSTSTVWETYTFFLPKLQLKIIEHDINIGGILCWKKWTIMGLQGVSGRCNGAIWLENFQSRCYSCAGTSPFIFSLVSKVEKFREIKANWRDCLPPGKFNKLCTSLLNSCTQSSLVEMCFQLPVTPV